MSLDRTWWPVALYPAAFPLAMVILIWGQAEVSVMELMRPATVAVVGSLIVTLVLGVLAGDRRMGGIASTAVAVAVIADRAAAVAALLAVAGIVVIVARRPGGHGIRLLPAATRGLAIVGTVALVAAVLSAVSRPGFVDDVREAFVAPPGPTDRPMPPAGSPDIFVYLLDGYPGRTAAAQAPWFDASAFPSALRSRGFVVHDDSRTNYLLTRLVLPTMLDGRYVGDIPALAPPFGPDHAVDASRLRRAQESSSGLAAIRGAGYDVMWVSSGWSHLDIRDVDRRIEAPGPSELEMVMLRSTGLGIMLQAVDPDGFARVMRDRIHGAFAAATSLAAEPHQRPRFVFVHVPAPHPPTVFRADGSDEDGSPEVAWDTVTSGPETVAQRRERTFAQVQAVASMTTAGIDALRAAAATPPAIIVFSDHGTDIGFDPRSLATSDLRERTSDFIAALTPGHPDLFAEGVTPINLIGTLANGYLGTSIPIQDDRSYGYRDSVLDVAPLIDTPTGPAMAPGTPAGELRHRRGPG